MKKLLAIVGPTGIGKTALAIEMAQKYNGELISADSRQIYIGMDIATGKEVAAGQWQQRRGQKALVIADVPIFGLDLVQPDQEFSVFDWMQLVRSVIDKILSDGKRPIIVGGTGFYLQALQGKIATLQVQINHELRHNLNQLSVEGLQEKLQQIDAVKWKSLNSPDQSNPRRLIRAIEVALQSTTAEYKGLDVDSGLGQKSQSWKDGSPSSTPHSFHMLGLTMERDILYAKVDARIEQMFAQGLIEETRHLVAKYSRQLPAMSGIGYAESAAYLAGETSLEKAIQEVKWRTHAYIRRQYTWFRKQEVQWVDVGQPSWHKALQAIIKSVGTRQ